MHATNFRVFSNLLDASYWPGRITSPVSTSKNAGTISSFLSLVSSARTGDNSLKTCAWILALAWVASWRPSCQAQPLRIRYWALRRKVLASRRYFAGGSPVQISARTALHATRSGDQGQNICVPRPGASALQKHSKTSTSFVAASRSRPAAHGRKLAMPAKAIRQFPCPVAGNAALRTSSSGDEMSALIDWPGPHGRGRLFPLVL